MNTWFSVHKNEQFLEDHDVQMNIIHNWIFPL
jgi:hypothetical protein